MSQIFVFTAGNPEARQHLYASIRTPIRPSTVFGNFRSELQDELEEIRKQGNGFYAWGATPGERNTPNWQAMQRGDFVLCAYDGVYHYASRVLAAYHNRRVARAIWGVDEEGRTWEYMYFLTKPVQVGLPFNAFERYLHKRYQGFTKISEPRLDAIEAQFGNITSFISRLLGRQDGTLPVEMQIDSAWIEQAAEESLEVDDLAHGIVDKGFTPKSEGQRRVVNAVQYERNPQNRRQAINIHGTTCVVCGFNFDEVYGREHARSFIHIHHVNPVSQHQGPVDPATDLVPLCPNCHAMAHRKRDDVTSIEELKELIATPKS